MTVTRQNVNAVNMSKAAPQLQSEMYFLKALYSHLRDILSASKLISLNEMGLLADTGTLCICIKGSVCPFFCRHAISKAEKDPCLVDHYYDIKV